MRRNLDHKIWFYTVTIIILGLVALYSASTQNVRVSKNVFINQSIFAVIGLIAMFFLGKIDYRKFYDIAYLFYFINIIFLVWVLISGRHVLGARRWVEIAGLTFQPSEITKLSLILLLGRYLSHRRPRLSFNVFSNVEIFMKDIMWPFLIVLVSIILIYIQPDLGTAILLFGIFIIMLYVGGVDYRYLLGFLGVCLSLLPFFWNILKSYQKDRLLVFLNPNIDPLGTGYTIIQSKIAIGSGQFFGKGWLSGTQNQLNFLPERHTDFIFSVIGEEWGLLGAVILMACYLGLIHISLLIAEQVKDQFGMLVAVGVVSILTLQVFINMGMVMGLLPVVGLTLPFVSYGRSSFLVFIIMMGFLLNLSRRRTIF